MTANTTPAQDAGLKRYYVQKFQMDDHRVHKNRIVYQAADVDTLLQSKDRQITELVAALNRIFAIGSDGEHSGDRHALCRQIARTALAQHATPQAGDMNSTDRMQTSTSFLTCDEVVALVAALSQTIAEIPE